MLPGEVRQQSAAGGGLHIGQAGRGGPGQLQALLQGEHGMLFPVDHDAQYDPVKNGGGPLRQIQVAHGDGVEAAWADGGFHPCAASSRK